MTYFADTDFNILLFLIPLVLGVFLALTVGVIQGKKHAKTKQYGKEAEIDNK